MSYSQKVHHDISSAIKNQLLETDQQRVSFKYKPTINNRLSKRQKSTRRRNMLSFYEKYYLPLILDTRFYFKFNNEIGISIHVRNGFIGNGEVIPSIKGYKSIQLSKEEAASDPSCIMLYTTEIKDDSDFKQKRNEIQHYKLLGSLSFLNHACLNCVTAVPYDLDSTEDKEYCDLSMIKSIPKDEQVTISYGNFKTKREIPYPCIKCKQFVI